MGLHYVLDAHPTLGNNAQIIKKLQAKIVDTLADEWGFVAELAKPQDIHDFGHTCQEMFNHEVFVVEGNKEIIKRVGVVSGAHLPEAFDFYEMHEKRIEALLVGETAEWIPHQMQESGIAFFACGHYATETFGVKALGGEIKKEFGKKVEVEFIDVENPI